MSHLQHERIAVLARELRLGALPDLYGPIAQTAAKKKDASYADFLEEVLRATCSLIAGAHGPCVSHRGLNCRGSKPRGCFFYSLD